MTIWGTGFYSPLSVRFDSRTTALTTKVVSPTKVVVTVAAGTDATRPILTSLGGTTARAGRG
jgi:hypothetical protein